MHIIHKLRRSISHRPRHIFDLPDEILCLILEYCCQDLDFLLWTCPLVTLENQFCHDCFHCTLCHGPVPRRAQRLHSSSWQRTHRQSEASFPESTTRARHTAPHRDTNSYINSDNSGGGGSSGSVGNNAISAGLRKRRKRCHETTTCVSINSNSSYRGRGGGRQCHGNGSVQDAIGAKPCPWNGNRPWCYHLQQRQRSSRIPLLHRLFPQFWGGSGLTSPFYHLTSLRITLCQYLPSRLLADPARDPLLEFPSPHLDDLDSVGTSTGSRLVHNEIQHRRRAQTMTGHSTKGGASSTTMNRSRSIGRSTHTGGAEQGDDSDDWSDSSAREDSESNAENSDNFDDSMRPSPPFQLLLVSSRFADAAVQSLWRNLVFHGQDSYQMQSLLATLSLEDGLEDLPLKLDRHSPGLEELKEVEEGDLEASAAVERGAEQAAETHDVSGRTDARSHQQRPPWQPQQGQGERPSWLESINNSLKQLPRLTGVTGGHISHAEASWENNAAISKIGRGDTAPGIHRQRGVYRQQRYAATGSYVQSGSKYHGPGFGRDDGGGFHVDRAKSHRAAPYSPRWPYRRYVRRVVLNFAHPQASPEMLVNVLECLQSRCPDQIQALDLHANEKMRGAGLEEPEKLKRLFGSGFSKLRSLRLQGGFVDNQLLCALIKSLNSPEPTSLSPSGRSSLDTSGNHREAFAEVPAPPLRAIAPCCLSQVFLGPGSITDSAIEKLVAAAGHSLEVFTVTSCVDVGGRALAELLTKCSKLRVLAVHRSLARDKDLLEGLGIEIEVAPSSTAQSPEMNITTTLNSTLIDGNSNGSGRGSAPKIVKKQIVAPLERLELGMVKLTKVGVSEILKGTCNTLRFLVLETQHFNEELLTDVITPLCTRLEGLYFDDPETLQRQQHQMQGLGFSAGRRGSHLPNRHFEFGRSKRTFLSDPNRQYQQVSAHLQQQRQHQQQLFGIDDRQSLRLGVDSIERQHSTQPTPLSAKISAWLGETSTEEWITYGDCALWINAASPSVSFENGAKNPGNHGQGGNQHHPRRQPLPLHHAYHSPAIMSTLMRSDGSGRVTEFNPLMSSFMGEYEDVLERFWMRRETVENVLHSLKRLGAFTVMQMDLIMENRGLSEWKTMMRQDELWVQSTGFRALQLFYLCLFLSMIYFGTFRW